MKDSFILYLEQKEIFDMLSDEEAGRLIKTIFEYEETGQEPELEKLIKIAFIQIKNSLDRNREKYDKVVERNQKNIKKRWEEKNTKNTTGKFGKKENTKNTDNDNDNDNDNEHDSDSVVEEVKEEIDSCVDGFQKVIDFYNNNIGLITPFAVETLQDYAKEMDLEVIIYALEKAVGANARNLNFIKAILNNWSKKGIKTLLQAQEENQQFHSDKIQKGTSWRSKENQEWRKEWLEQNEQ